MNSDEFAIIEVFSKGWHIELTINQIAKHIKKSYAYTNKYTHQLIEQNILHTKEVGSAILCSLNFAHPKTIAALSFISLSNMQTIHDSTGICFRVKQKIYCVGDQQKTTSHSLSLEQLQLMLPQLQFDQLKIISGAEQFWKTVAKVKT